MEGKGDSVKIEERARQLEGDHPDSDLDGLKASYKMQHQKHEIHKVDNNHEIIMEEANIDEFAVKLKIRDIMPPIKSFGDEMSQLFEPRKGMRVSDIKLSDLIDNCNRVTFIRGTAGMGKTVLVKQMACQWAVGELFENYNLIKFECRELNYFVRNKWARFRTHELLSEFIKSTFSCEFKSEKDILFIIDGLDELFDVYTDKSIIWQLLDLQTSNYPMAKFIITGRPHVQPMLFREDKYTGSVKVVEINGFTDEQIKEYFIKFASSDADIATIYKTKDIAITNLPLLRIPQFLNTFCCVALLSKTQGVPNEAEVYCWILYLLLKQHAEKDSTSNKGISEIFNDYSTILLVLCKVCYDILNNNSSIFKEDIKLRIGDIGKGKEFLEGMFSDVSDNVSERKQFKHLTLVEFLSAFYVCITENPMEIIKDILRNRFYQVSFFSCQLISGFMYDGIIKKILVSRSSLQEITAKHFLCNVLEFLRLNSDDINYSFNISISVVRCVMKKDVVNKQLMMSMLKELKFQGVGLFGESSRSSSTTSSNMSIQMMDILMSEFKWSEKELKNAFENVHFEFFTVKKIQDMKYAKYLASVKNIRLIGMETTVTLIRKEIDEIIESGACKEASIWNCKLEDMSVDQSTSSSKLKLLRVYGCSFNRKSFINILKWVRSSVEELTLHKIATKSKEGWFLWRELVSAIDIGKDKKNGNLLLKKLNLFDCSHTSKKNKEMIVQNGVELTIDGKSVVSPSQRGDEQRNKQGPPSEKDDKEHHKQFIRYEVKMIPKSGATMELHITGITLQVPEDAFTTNTKVELSTVDSSSSPEYPADIGEKLLGNIIKVGPTDIKFNFPATLSIPYSIVDIPEHSSIWMNYFDENSNQWVRISDHHEANKSVGPVEKPGYYAICLLLDVESHVISQSPVAICPLNMQDGVKIVFDENTFLGDETKVKFKINHFTERMCKNFESSGIKPIIIFHVNFKDNAQPYKPVSISLPLPVDVIQRKEILVLQCDRGDKFIDVTKHIVFDWSESHVVLRVVHFTKYAVFSKTSQAASYDASRVQYLQRTFRNMFEVYVCVYENRKKGRVFRVGCCEAHIRNEMDSQMDIDFFNVVESFTTRMHHNTELSFQLKDCHRIGETGKIASILFKENTMEMTDSLELHPTDSLENTSTISIFVKDTKTSYIVELKENSTPGGTNAQGMANSIGNPQENSEAPARASNEEQSLSDLTEDFHTMSQLDNKLDVQTVGNIKDLSLRLPLSYKERCIVLNSILPCLSFFSHFFKWKKNEKLSHLKEAIETFSSPPNMMIFKKINDDEVDGVASISLTSTFAELAADPKILKYVMDNIAKHLVLKEGTLLPSWKDVGSLFGYSSFELILFCKNNQNEECKIKKLFSFMASKEGSFTISNLIEKLQNIKRNDLVTLVQKRRERKMDEKKAIDPADAIGDKPKLSQLQEDYNLTETLSDSLDSSLSRCIIELCLKFKIPEEDCKKIVNEVPPCHAFFESLAVSQPCLSLKDIKDAIEEFSLPNKSIFPQVEDDIQKAVVSFSLHAQLGELLDNSECWLYVLNTIAYKLIPEPSTKLPSWEKLAGTTGYTVADIDKFKRKNKVTDGPTKRLLSFLVSNEPLLLLTEFTDKLKSIGRHDVAKKISEVASTGIFTPRPSSSYMPPHSATARPQKSTIKRRSLIPRPIAAKRTESVPKVPVATSISSQSSSSTKSTYSASAILLSSDGRTTTSSQSSTARPMSSTGRPQSSTKRLQSSTFRSKSPTGRPQSSTRSLKSSNSRSISSTGTNQSSAVRLQLTGRFQSHAKTQSSARSHQSFTKYRPSHRRPQSSTGRLQSSTARPISSSGGTHLSTGGPPHSSSATPILSNKWVQSSTERGHISFSIQTTGDDSFSTKAGKGGER